MTFRTQSDISDARLRRVTQLTALAACLGVAFDHARAMAVEISRQQDITFDEAIAALSSLKRGR